MFPSPHECLTVNGTARSVLQEADISLREALLKCRLNMAVEHISTGLDDYLVTILLSIAADLGVESQAAAKGDLDQAFMQAAGQALLWAKSRAPTESDNLES